MLIYDNNKKNFSQDQENDSESSESYGGSKEEIVNGETVTSGVVLIKKSYVSLLRPMDTLETLALNPNMNIDAFRNGIELLGKSLCDF